MQVPKIQKDRVGKFRSHNKTKTARLLKLDKFLWNGKNTIRRINYTYYYDQNTLVLVHY